jgi:predicted metal-dependent hydrolase
MPRAKKTTEEGKEVKETKVRPSGSEFEKKVIELAEKGLTAEKIGETLRREGVHSREYEKISKILKKKGRYVNPDLKNMETKLEKIKAHVNKNKQDKRAIIDKEKADAKLRRAKHYFKQ